ncbi:hypothetical protein ACHQM5_018169 [Ranunculus cassubicifolius]
MEKLPSEITTNILLRLPFKSTGICKCVSKQWLSIISDPKFLINQLSISINPDILLFFRDPKSRWSGICYLEDDDDVKVQPLQKNSIVEPYITYDHQFVPESHFHRAVLLGNCNGFVTLFNCSSFEGSNLPKNPIFIVNPITNERAPLPYYETPLMDFTPPKTLLGERKYDKLLSGLVFRESEKVFKLVLVMFTAIDLKCDVFRNEVQVCTLGLGSGSGSITWKRKSGIVPDLLRGCYEKVSNAFVNECLHWVIVDESSLYGGPTFVSFNLDEETFGYVPCPGSQLSKLTYDYYELGVLERKLAVVECSPKRGVEIWIMENYDVKESWVKKYSIRNDLLSRDVNWDDVRIVKLRKNGELLLLYDTEYLVCYNTNSKK